MTANSANLSASDGAYLEWLYRELADPRWLSTVDGMRGEPGFIESQIEQAMLKRDPRAVAPAEYRQLLEQAFHPRQAFLGTYINDVRHLALRLLGDGRSAADAIPVALMPTGTMNACCIRTPQGGHVILLNSGLTHVITDLIKDFFAFASWHSPRPYCRDFKQVEYAARFVRQARFAIGGDPELLIGMPAATPGASDWLLSDWDLSRFGLYATVFVLLHEYGHAVLGHLQDALPRTIPLGVRTSVTGFRTVVQKEFEADEFAVTHFSRSADGDDLVLGGFVVGFLFRLFDFFEAVDSESISDADRTHPPAAERWTRAKALMGDRASTSATMDVDGVFDGLLRAWAALRNSVR